MAVSLALLGLPQYYNSIAQLQEDPEQHLAIVSAACTNVRKILVDDKDHMEDQLKDEEKQRRKWMDKLPPVVLDALEVMLNCRLVCGGGHLCLSARMLLFAQWRNTCKT